MLDIAVVDYGMGNLRSVHNALLKVAPAASIAVTGDPREVAQAARVVFPGQGAMPDCMRELEMRGLREAVLQAARSKPFLGICIGLQMLFEHSAEGDTPGLGILPGKVVRFASQLRDEQGSKLKVPHMGWNQVRRINNSPPLNGEVTVVPFPTGVTSDLAAAPPSRMASSSIRGLGMVSVAEHPLWEGIAQDERFYFVHSYYVRPQDAPLVQATSDYPQPFVCAVARDNLFAVQFHPEKSSRAGLTLLQNFMKWDPV